MRGLDFFVWGGVIYIFSSADRVELFCPDERGWLARGLGFVLFVLLLLLVLLLLR